MSRHPRYRTTLLLLAAVLLLAACGGGAATATNTPAAQPTPSPTDTPAPARTATVRSVEGDVTVTDTPGAAPRTPAPGERLGVGAELATGMDGRAVIELDDTTAVLINPESRFTLTELGGTTASPVTRFFMNLGAVFAFRLGQAPLPAGAAFEIGTPNGLFAIRGSSMGVKHGEQVSDQPQGGTPQAGETPAAPGAITTLLCLTGSCTAAGTDGQPVDLDAGQKVTVDAQGVVSAIAPVTDQDQEEAARAFEVVQDAGVLPGQPLDMPTPIPPTPVPAGFPGSPVTGNAAWTPIIQQVGGVDMALVPVGCFQMGSNQSPDELPVHEQCFDTPFWIDVYEVTNGQYGSEGAFAGASRPRETLTWRDALTFCQARGGRLPTEAEWEYAARGPDNLVYPWGNSFVAANTVYYGNSGDRTADVGSRPGGVSWVGAYDMSGNVYEYTSSIYLPYPYDPTDGRENLADTTSRRVLRGGSFGNAELGVYASRRYPVIPASTGNVDGFRCARDLQPGDLP